MKQAILFLKQKGLTDDEIKMTLLSICSHTYMQSLANKSLEAIMSDANSQVISK